MQAEVRLYCAQCAQLTHHATVGRFDVWGHLTGVVERCLRCGKETPASQADRHEAPATDPMPVTTTLAPIEIAWCRYMQWRYAHGALTEECAVPVGWE
jgi:hypothetical protein